MIILFTTMLTACNRGTSGLEYKLINDDTAYEVSVGNVNTDVVNNIIIPAKYRGKPVTSIAYHGFYGHSGMTSITIPDSATNFGYEAFSGCSGLTSIILPKNLTYIPSGAFGGCTALTDIIIPDSVRGIGHHAFTTSG